MLQSVVGSLIRVRKVPDSNLCLVIGHSEGGVLWFCQSLNVNTGLGPQIEPPLFVSNLLFKGKGKGCPVSCPSRHRGRSRDVAVLCL